MFLLTSVPVGKEAEAVNGRPCPLDDAVLVFLLLALPQAMTSLERLLPIDIDLLWIIPSFLFN